MSKADLLIEMFKEAAECTKCERFSGKRKEAGRYDGLINIFKMIELH